MLYSNALGTGALQCKINERGEFVVTTVAHSSIRNAMRCPSPPPVSWLDELSKSISALSLRDEHAGIRIEDTVTTATKQHSANQQQLSEEESEAISGEDSYSSAESSEEEIIREVPKVPKRTVNSVNDHHSSDVAGKKAEIGKNKQSSPAQSSVTPEMHRKKTTPIPRTPPPKEPSSSSSESESESGNQSNSDHDISNHQTAAKHCLSTPRKEVVEILFPSSGDDSETSDSPPAPNPKRRKKSSVTKNSSKVTSKKNECADSDSDTPKSPPSPQVKPKRPTKPRSHRTRKSVMPSSPSHETWKDIPICHSIPIGSELRDFLLKYPYQRKVPARKRQSCIGVETPTDPNAGHKIVFRFSSPDTPTEESVIPALKTKTSSSGLIFLRRGKAQQDPLPRHCDKLLIVMLGTAEISIQGRGTTKLFPHDQVSVPSGSHFTIQNTPRTKLCKVAYVYRNTTGS